MNKYDRHYWERFIKLCRELEVVTKEILNDDYVFETNIMLTV